ncbi:MAG: hypothetical protein Q8R82_09070, partial [Hyphomonadaceae bacterium]|nr:hypothetical protein [Hyphomonadaceae bacterium]
VRVVTRSLDAQDRSRAAETHNLSLPINERTVQFGPSALHDVEIAPLVTFEEQVLVRWHLPDGSSVRCGPAGG